FTLRRIIVVPLLHIAALLRRIMTAGHFTLFATRSIPLLASLPMLAIPLTLRRVPLRYVMGLHHLRLGRSGSHFFRFFVFLTRLLERRLLFFLAACILLRFCLFRFLFVAFYDGFFRAIGSSCFYDPFAFRLFIIARVRFPFTRRNSLF